MRSGEGRGANLQTNSDDVEIVGNDRRKAFSGPLAGAAPSQQFSRNRSRKSARSRNSNSAGEMVDDYVEITLDIHDDSVAIHSVQTATDDPEQALMAKRTLGKKSSSSSMGSSVLRSASAKIRQVSQELKRFASLSKRPSAATRFDRNKSAAVHALKGLKFVAAKTSGASGWPAIEKRFDELTSSTNGLLDASLFGECIGRVKSKI